MIVITYYKREHAELAKKIGELVVNKSEELGLPNSKVKLTKGFKLPLFSLASDFLINHSIPNVPADKEPFEIVERLVLSVRGLIIKNLGNPDGQQIEVRYILHDVEMTTNYWLQKPGR